MNIGLKMRLVIAFVTIIVLPILTTLGLLTYMSSHAKINNQDLDTLLQELFIEVQSEVKEHSRYFDEPDLFYSKIEPLITKFDINITIKTVDQKMIFNSKDYQERDDSRKSRFNMDEIEIYATKLEVDPGHFVNVEISANSSSETPFQGLQQILMSIFISIGSGIVVLILLIIIWTWYIAKTVLNPLRQVFTATEEMSHGNLNYEISYNKKDEIGRFINGFNLMRTNLKEANNRQKKLEKNRKELIASISHDLRTPLASIKGYVEGLQDGIAHDVEMRNRYLDVIKKKTDQLDHLIEDLFDFSKLELNELPMEKVVVDSEQYFSDVYNHMKLDIEQRDVEFSINEDYPSRPINIDKYRVQQVITNLVDNAIRYGGTKVTLAVEELEETQQILISISDNGSGIGKEDLPHIFNRFYRAEKSRSSEHGGTGLGLAISNEIIKAHHGELSVKSERGKGSTISFTIPCFIK
ncbi:hypothetical protein BKP35_05005 [Anaerobacillus arseniciselenatis]|uniref:histidine kinase n=1 Tax=Anaerobacillus arseniciselenatis TaxID=85682 RepID=A0A1S2LRR9_9BACI|nr:ATP-binding protein [Anaerobacillus arseniciselenatis]OIJ15208.1 hypothetical protein BKP35_05005 [Anaerobacillus arseniciselenatis]